MSAPLLAESAGVAQPALTQEPRDDGRRANRRRQARRFRIVAGMVVPAGSDHRARFNRRGACLVKHAAPLSTTEDAEDTEEQS